MSRYKNVTDRGMPFRTTIRTTIEERHEKKLWFVRLAIDPPGKGRWEKAKHNRACNKHLQ